MFRRIQTDEVNLRSEGTPQRDARLHALTTMLIVMIVVTLVVSALLDITPAHAQLQLAPGFKVMLIERFFGAQALSVKPLDFSHPDRAQFSITNTSELWYSVQAPTATDALKPVAANPTNDLVSAAMAESELLMPSDSIPLNPNLSLFQRVTLESHFTAPNQTVSIQLDPFTFDAGTFDSVRLALMLVGQNEIADEVGIVVPGAIKEIIQAFHSNHELAKLVNDFVTLLTTLERGQSLVLPAAVVFDDLVNIASDGADLGALGSALGKVVGRSVNVKPLKVVLNSFDGTKYLIDLTRSFGPALFLNGNYPTITLQSVTTEPPTSSSQSQWKLASDDLGNIVAGPDGDMWFIVGGASIGRIASDGQMSIFPVPSAASIDLLGLTSGPDDAVWFTDLGNGVIGRITHDGQVSEFTDFVGAPKGITTGPDGNLWFVDGSGAVGKITPDGQVTEFPILSENSLPYSITTGPDGNLWFTELGAEQIGRVTPAGRISEFLLPTGMEPLAITTGPDGNLWFTERTVDVDGAISGSRIGRITPDGHITEFSIPTSDTEADAITTGPDGNLWFVDWGALGNSVSADVGRITPGGSLTFPIPGLQRYSLIIVDGIAKGWDGDLWITGETDNGDPSGNSAYPVISRIKP